MMRTIEILLVIIIITGAFITASFFAVLPQPRRVSPINLNRLALTTLQALDTDHDLSRIVFIDNDTVWSELHVALSAILPPNLVYNLTVYEVSTSGSELYTPKKSISNAESLGISSDASSYLAASSNVTFNVNPERIGEHGGGGTLYILNCSDANGWWITGYTSQRLAEDLSKMLSTYFQATIMVQNTTQLGELLDGTKISTSPYEDVDNAVIINTCGEAVPIPSGNYSTQGSTDNYAKYCHILGQKVSLHNWTWVSIVGYPLYYVCNTGLFPNDQNTWGIYGMKRVGHVDGSGSAGLNSFLKGLNNETYVYNDTWITGELTSVYLSSDAMYCCNYYGIYPSRYQTATRALPDSILTLYNLTVTSYVLDKVGGWIAGAVYKHAARGAFLALGLTRTPDIRLTALGLLCNFKPRLYASAYTASGTSRLIVLQLGQVGGV